MGLAGCASVLIIVGCDFLRKGPKVALWNSGSPQRTRLKDLGPLTWLNDLGPLTWLKDLGPLS